MPTIPLIDLIIAITSVGRLHNAPLGFRRSIHCIDDRSWSILAQVSRGRHRNSHRQNGTAAMSETMRRKQDRQFPPKGRSVPGTARPPVSSAHGNRVLNLTLDPETSKPVDLLFCTGVGQGSVAQVGAGLTAEHRTARATCRPTHHTAIR